MDCPVCGDKLKAIEKYGVEVDVCPGCKGVWLDRGEIEKILAADSGDQAPAGRSETAIAAMTTAIAGTTTAIETGTTTAARRSARARCWETYSAGSVEETTEP